MSSIKFGSVDGEQRYLFMSPAGPSPILMEIDEVPLLFGSVQAYLNYTHLSRNAEKNRELMDKVQYTLDPLKTNYFCSKRGGATLDPKWSKGGKKSPLVKAAYKAIVARYTQCPVLARLLLETGKSKLVYVAPWDPVLGTGKDGDGENLWGAMLERVRKKLKSGDLKVEGLKGSKKSKKGD